jgi:Concanavalin A-like lectin/glucanases superfamily/Secretion system C-terminal sorting domain
MKNLLLIIFFNISLSLLIKAQIPLTGLERYYPFTGNANDSSGNNQNGTVIGATLTTDRFGNEDAAYSFDGSTSNYINIPTNDLDIEQYTYSAWALLYSIPDFDERYWVLDVGSVAGDQFLNYNHNYSGQYPSPNGWGSGGYNSSSPHGFLYQYNPSELNQWVHLVVTRSSTTSIFYVNGEYVDSLEVSLENIPYYGSGTLTARIGNRYNYQYPFHGKIDDIGFWNRPLTPEEVVGLHNDCKISLIEQPLSQIANIGEEVNFTVETSGNDLAYQWQSNIGFGFQNLSDAGQYTGTNTSTLTVSNTSLSNNNQLFKCLVSSGDCLIRSSEVSLTILDGVGIGVADEPIDFSIFPNPSNGKFKIVFNQTAFKEANLIVTNTLGQEIFICNNITNKFSFDVTKLCSKGIYFAQIIDADGNRIGIEKLVFE